MYELVYILPPDYDEEKREIAHKSVIKTITSRNGALVKDDFLGERLLKYPVKGLSKGLYYIIEFTIPVDHLDDLKKDLNLNEEIIRYIITKTELSTESTEDENKEEKKEPSSEEEKKEDKKPAKKKYSIKKTEEEMEKATKKEKASLDDLDKKLDEILD
jgi:small subunit ribosomal protein S6